MDEPEETHEEFLENLRAMIRKNKENPDHSFRASKIVYKIVTNLKSDTFAATLHMNDLVKLIGKPEADKMVAKGLQNQKNKKRIV